MMRPSKLRGLFIALGFMLVSCAYTSSLLAQVHGCTLETATDRRGEAQVQFTWTNPHSSCIIVSPGTKVTWVGNFTMHPLAGGVSPTTDAGNPISSAAANQGSVTLNALGDYPYFCEIHVNLMRGVVYVRQPAGFLFADGFETPGI